MGACVKKKYTIIFTSDSMLIKKGDTTMIVGTPLENNLFEMMIRVIRNEEANVATIPELQFIHERLGHINLRTIIEMKKQGLIQMGSISTNALITCEACHYGKQHRLPFKKISRPKETKPGEFVHTDVGGPMRETSLGGSRFYVNFIDDASGFRKVYFMRHKSDVFEKFREYHTLIRNKFQRSMKTLRMDNGTEYINDNLQRYLIANGIQVETTCPYTPE